MKKVILLVLLISMISATAFASVYPKAAVVTEVWDEEIIEFLPSGFTLRTTV